MSDLDRAVTVPEEERQKVRFGTAYENSFGKSIDLYNRLDKIYRRMNPVSVKGAEFWCRVSRTRSKLSSRLEFIYTKMYFNYFDE